MMSILFQSLVNVIRDIVESGWLQCREAQNHLTDVRK